jgi:hypothetical protein
VADQLKSNFKTGKLRNSTPRSLPRPVPKNRHLPPKNQMFTQMKTIPKITMKKMRPSPTPPSKEKRSRAYLEA